WWSSRSQAALPGAGPPPAPATPSCALSFAVGVLVQLAVLLAPLGQVLPLVGADAGVGRVGQLCPAGLVFSLVLGHVRRVLRGLVPPLRGVHQLVLETRVEPRHGARRGRVGEKRRLTDYHLFAVGVEVGLTA